MVNRVMKILMLCLSPNAFLLLVYTLKHILFLNSLFTFFELEIFCILFVHYRRQEGKSDPVLEQEKRIRIWFIEHLSLSFTF